MGKGNGKIYLVLVINALSRLKETEMENSTLIDEIAAEIELSLPDAAHRTAERFRRLRLIKKGLLEAGLIRNLDIDPFDSSPLDVSGISTAMSSLPSNGGLLYGVSSLAYGLRISRTDVLDAWQMSRVNVGDIDFAGSDERIRWKQAACLPMRS